MAPRFDPSSRTQSKDRIGGIGIVVASILSVGGGLGSTGLGSAPGLVGRLAGLIGMSAQTTERAALFGGAIAFLSTLRIAGGLGIVNGRRWGFILTALLTSLSLPLNLGHLAHGTAKAGLLLTPLILYYCWRRLSKEEAPTPT